MSFHPERIAFFGVWVAVACSALAPPQSYAGGAPVSIDQAAVIDVTKLGAIGDDDLDDTLALIKALRLSEADGRSIYFPTGRYMIANVRVRHPVRIYGEGVSSILQATTDGPLITIASATHVNDERHVQGIVIEKLRLLGDRRRWNASAIQCVANDHFKLADLWIEDFVYEALDFYSSCREGVVLNVHTRYCGSKSADRPAIRIIEHSRTADANNNIYFQNCFFNFSLGDTVVIDTVAGARKSTSMIAFNSCMIHGIDPAAVRYNVTREQLQSTLVRVGDAHQVSFQAGTRLTSAGFNAPALHMEDVTHGEPEVILANVRITQHVHPDGVSKDIDMNPGILVEKGRLVALGGVYLAGNTPSYVVGENATLVNPAFFTILTGTRPRIRGDILGPLD